MNDQKSNSVQLRDYLDAIEQYHGAFQEANISSLLSIDKFFASILIGTIAGLSLLLLKTDIEVTSLVFFVLGLIILFLGMLNISYRIVVYHICINLTHSQSNALRTLLYITPENNATESASHVRNFERLYAKIIEESSQGLSTIVDYITPGYILIGLGVLVHSARSSYDFINWMILIASYAVAGWAGSCVAKKAWKDKAKKTEIENGNNKLSKIMNAMSTERTPSAGGPHDA